jgi:hypothetical protein
VVTPFDVCPTSHTRHVVDNLNRLWARPRAGTPPAPVDARCHDSSVVLSFHRDSVDLSFSRSLVLYPLSRSSVPLHLSPLPVWQEWGRRDEKGQSILVLRVTPAIGHRNHIAGDMTAKEVWDKLTQCSRKDMATRVSLMQQLFTARVRDAESVDKHISAMNDIRTQLANIGKPVDDAVAALSLLLSVSAEVPQWVMFLCNAKATSSRRAGRCTQSCASGESRRPLRSTPWL